MKGEALELVRYSSFTEVDCCLSASAGPECAKLFRIKESSLQINIAPTSPTSSPDTRHRHHG